MFFVGVYAPGLSVKFAGSQSIKKNSSLFIYIFQFWTDPNDLNDTIKMMHLHLPGPYVISSPKSLSEVYCAGMYLSYLTVALMYNIFIYRYLNIKYIIQPPKLKWLCICTFVDRDRYINVFSYCSGNAQPNHISCLHNGQCTFLFQLICKDYDYDAQNETWTLKQTFIYKQ